MEYLKECTVGAHRVKVLMKSPSTCTTQHDRACQRCWERHLSNEAETMQDGSLRCMFCLTVMVRQDLSRLARKGTLERYDALLQARITDGAKHMQCPDRCVESRIEPSFGRSTRWQAHDPATDGRIFSCAYCAKQTCVTCDRPEHVGKTCAEYRMAFLADEERVVAEDASNEFVHSLPTCPECDQPYEYGGGCAYFQCGRCKYRFCGECWAPWVGPRGEYEMGRLAHSAHCKFSSEDPHEDHMYRSSDQVPGPEGREDGGRCRAAKARAVSKIGVSERGLKRERADTGGESTRDAEMQLKSRKKTPS